MSRSCGGSSSTSRLNERVNQPRQAADGCAPRPTARRTGVRARIRRKRKFSGSRSRAGALPAAPPRTPRRPRCVEHAAVRVQLIAQLVEVALDPCPPDRSRVAAEIAERRRMSVVCRRRWGDEPHRSPRAMRAESRTMGRAPCAKHPARLRPSRPERSPPAPACAPRPCARAARRATRASASSARTRPSVCACGAPGCGADPHLSLAALGELLPLARLARQRALLAREVRVVVAAPVHQRPRSSSTMPWPRGAGRHGRASRTAAWLPRSMRKCSIHRSPGDVRWLVG